MAIGWLLDSNEYCANNPFFFLQIRRPMVGLSSGCFRMWLHATMYPPICPTSGKSKSSICDVTMVCCITFPQPVEDFYFPNLALSVSPYKGFHPLGVFFVKYSDCLVHILSHFKPQKYSFFGYNCRDLRNLIFTVSEPLKDVVHIFVS